MNDNIKFIYINCELNLNLIYKSTCNLINYHPFTLLG